MKLKNFLNVGIMVFSLLFSTYIFAQTMPTDSDITTVVKTRIAGDYSLSGTKVDVKTLNGVVTLIGNVASDTQASNVIEIAQSTTGVKDVDISKLTVTRSQQPMTDMFITAKIKGMFIQQKLFGDNDIAAMNINVETNNGIVSLSGTVDNQEQANNAIKIAKQVGGVKDVKSNIKIAVTNQ